MCVAWPASLQLQQGSSVADVTYLRRIQTVRDKLIFYDEVLTTSARICALTGRPEFLQVYLDTVGPLEKNLDEILQLLPSEAQEFRNRTATANEQLIRLETEGLRGCSQGVDVRPAEEAAAYLMGPEYEKWKGDYIYGIQVLSADINNFLQQEKATAWQSTVYLWTIAIVVMMLMGVSQAARQSQEEESDRLTAEFDERLGEIRRKSFLELIQCPAGVRPGSGEGAGLLGTFTGAPGEGRSEAPAQGSSDARPAGGTGGRAQGGQKKKKGLWRRMAAALSPMDIIHGAPLPKMERSTRLLRSWMPWVLILTHFIGLGCILAPPFMQMQTEGLVRMGHLLGEISTLVDDIRYYDEVLTGSARLCALTGDIRWMTRYLSNVGQIDSAISNVVGKQKSLEDKYPRMRKIFGENVGEQFLETTDSANKKLMELEGEVVSNCADAYLNHRDDLFSGEYMENKVILLQGLDKLAKDVVDSVQEQEQANSRTVNVQYYSVVVSLVAVRGLVGLLFAYYYVKLNWLDSRLKVASVKGTIEARLNSGGTSVSRLAWAGELR